MRSSDNIFHIAIPSHDLSAAENFYVNQLGCKLARKYKDRITIDFFGDQLVCHLCPDQIDTDPAMYPRHFGITFKNKVEFDNLLKLSEKRNINFFEKLFCRFEGKVEEHFTFFLKDPSNNLLEFKYYVDPRMMY